MTDKPTWNEVLAAVHELQQTITQVERQIAGVPKNPLEDIFEKFNTAPK